jgi:hypothetical protein
VAEQRPADEERIGAGRSVTEVAGDEPGRTYFTALGKWPEQVGMTRAELAERLECAPSTLSQLLGNRDRGPEAATPKALEWARRIISACDGTAQDLANWTAFHHEVTRYKDDVIDELPAPPEPGKKYGGPSGPSAPEDRLRRLSERLAVELDLASSQSLDRDPHRLSAGLYVRRTQQNVVLDMLRPTHYDKPVLVHGVAGEGKSSLLWGLYQELRDNAALDVYLLNSPWLAPTGAGTSIISVEELQEVAGQACTRGCVAVFLIDTVDLLLHDELHRQEVLDLCELVTEAGAEVVLTSRPEEALTLPKASFRTVGLQPYDDVELPQAVDKHVALFCPDALPGSLDEKCQDIIESAARGLTVREIVLNPLKLRLLFELYQPEFPSLEHDVSSLYEMYWQRRVRTDQRGEAAIPDGPDLTRPAEHIAIALLATGGVELGEQRLSESATSVAANWPSARSALPDTQTAIVSLARRGVLIRSVHAVRFFHQTMFEYAAAVGLLARDGGRALRFLVSHLKKHPDDLFAGAITEQMLILAVDDRAIAPAAAQVLDDLAASGLPALQRVALGVLAHQPTMDENTERLIDTVDTAALRRYAQTIPTVAKVDTGVQVARLLRVWHRHESVRESVVEALARLSARNPAVVVAALRELDCVPIALTWRDNPARMVKLVARVLVAAAPADPLWTRAQLFTLFDHIIARNTHRAVPLYIVELIAGAWAVLGSPETAAELQERIVRAQEGHDAAASEMRKALGRIQALAWRDRWSALEKSTGGDTSRRDEWWLDVVEDLCGDLERDYYDVFANARVHAIAELMVTGALGVSLSVRTTERFSALRGSAPFAIGRLFPALFVAHDRAAAAEIAPVIEMIVAMLDGLPAPGNQPPEGAPRWAHVVRKALHNAGLTANTIAALLTGLPVARQVPNWLADEYLAVLLVPAAVGGHPQARAALDRVREDAGLLTAAGQKNISYDIIRHLDQHPDLLPVLVDLAVRRKSATPLSDVIPELDGELLVAIRKETPRLTELVDALFTGKGAERKEAANLWRRLYNVKAVPPPDHPTLVRHFTATSELAARGNILELATDATIEGELDPHIADRWLRDLFDVDRRTRAVVSPGGREAGHIAITARTAWLRLTCQGRRTDDVDFDELLDVASAAPVTVDTLAMLGYLIFRLAQQGRPVAATELLLRVTTAVDVVELSAKQENSLANKLRPAMRSIFRAAPVDDQRALLTKVPGLPMKHARVLVAAAAQENFPTLRPDLAALQQTELPPGVAQQIHDDVRVRSRSAASDAFPNLLLPLTGDVQE